MATLSWTSWNAMPRRELISLKSLVSQIRTNSMGSSLRSLASTRWLWASSSLSMRSWRLNLLVSIFWQENNNIEMKRRDRSGIIRNRFEALLVVKDKAKRKESRFSKKQTPNTSVSLSQSTSINQNSLLEKNSGIQLGIMTRLPPDWVDKYEDCQIILREVDDIKKEISSLHAKRLNTIIEKEEALCDRQIYEKATIATSKIGQCQRLLRQIKEIKAIETEKQVCDNLCSSLALSIQQKTRELRSQQKLYIEQRKRLESSTKVSFLDLAVENALGGEIYQDSSQMMEVELDNIYAQERNKEILKLVDTINELNEIYKEMSQLVLVQGTLLDRIDVNLDKTIDNIKKGNQNLVKTIQRQESPFAKRCILMMILALVFLGFALVIKHAR